MAQTDSILTFNVRRCEPELIAPASPTTRELKRLSDIDNQEGLLIHISAIFFYRPSENMQNKDPPPFPCIEELLYDVPGSGGLLNSPLLLIQVTRLLCGGFILTLRSSHPMADGSRIVQNTKASKNLREIVFAMKPKKIVKRVRKWRSEAQKSDASKRNDYATNKGHFVVYAADQSRFVMPLHYLNSNIFMELLRISEDEFGLPKNGPITLSCDSILMNYLVNVLERGLSDDLEKVLLAFIVGYMDQLHAFGKSYDNDMAINLINRSLNKDFGDFVRNINRHCMGKIVTELHALLNDYEKGLKDKAPTPQVLTIQKGRENKPKPQANKKDKSKGKTDKNKKVVSYQPKPKHNPLKRKENPNKDQTCHHCHVAGHWKRNCLFTSKSCEKIKTRLSTGFKEERKLSYGEQYLQVGNGAQAAVEAIGVFDLV
nr:auxin-responsive protein SAUR64-like [Tanacetum cinerariifolium]